MKTSHCSCGQFLFFENTQCVACEHLVAFEPGASAMLASDQPGQPTWSHPRDGSTATFQLCANAEPAACNWLVPVGGPELCLACRLNDTIPNLAIPEHRTHWSKLEIAKRRWLYGVLRLGIPAPTPKAVEPETGLAFRFLAPDPQAPADAPPVLTGHANGVITVNVSEADSVILEKTRRDMGEPYRTLLGHFRHESGHYYWDRLVRDGQRLPEFRELFGDDQAPYDQALQSYYDHGPAPAWPDRFVSAYASAHAWEDWAESWAHYLHIADTIETAHDFGLVGQAAHLHPGAAAGTLRLRPQLADFEAMIENWGWLTVAFNAINRSMGLPDPYPFVLAQPAIDKLHFVHQTIHSV